MASSRMRSYSVDFQSSQKRDSDGGTNGRVLSVGNMKQARDERSCTVDKVELIVRHDSGDANSFAGNRGFIHEVVDYTEVLDDREVVESSTVIAARGGMGDDRSGECSTVKGIVSEPEDDKTDKPNKSRDLVDKHLDEEDSIKYIDVTDTLLAEGDNGSAGAQPLIPESPSGQLDVHPSSSSSELRKRRSDQACCNLQKWLVLLAAFFCRMLGEGYTNAMGIFFVEFLAYYQSGRGMTGWIVSLTGGIMYGAGIPISFLVYKTSERFCAIAGAILACAGLIASSFSTSIIFLYFSFGIVPGIGMCMIQISYVIAVGRHFRDGRGAATAICETGVTVGGVAFPLLLRFLIETFDWRGALLISGGIILNMAAMGMFFGPPSPVKSRNSREQNDLSPTDTPQKYCDSGITQTRPFVVYVFISLLVAFGYYFPYGIIVDLGTLHGYSKENSTFLVIGLSVANTVGVAIMAGLLKLFWRHSTLLYTLNITLIGISMFVFPLASSFETLVLAIVLYGLPSGGLYGSYAVVVVDMLGEKRYTTGLGFACSAYGIGMALSAPAAGWINDETGDYQKCFYIGGSICLGAAFIFGSALVVENFRNKRVTRGTTFELTVS